MENVIEYGVFVDGVKQEPAVIGVRPERGMRDDFCYYKVEFPSVEASLILYLDPISRVVVNSQRYIDNVHKMGCTNDNYSIVVVEDSESTGDLFLGNSSLSGAITMDCELLNATIEVSDPEKETFILKGATVESSTLYDTCIWGKATISDSELSDSAIEGRDGTRLVSANIRNSSLFSIGPIDISEAWVIDSHLSGAKFLTVEQTKLKDVTIRAQSINLASIFHTMQIDLPGETLRFFRMGNKSYAICDKEGFWATRDFKEFDVRILDFMRNTRQTNPEDLAQYVVDCVDSRIKVIEMLEEKRAQEYLRLSAVC